MNFFIFSVTLITAGKHVPRATSSQSEGYTPSARQIGDSKMLKLVFTACLCTFASTALAQHSLTVDFGQAEIQRIDPGKTLDLIKRIKTAKDGVVS